jgi:hypothetical protein
MPDRLQDIYNTLEEMQADGGLGGGGGATDVSALAKELTLASVVTNTAATTVAIGELETNVITASGVQTLSLNSATSAQTSALTTALSTQTTAIGVQTTGQTTTLGGKLDSQITLLTDIKAQDLLSKGYLQNIDLFTTENSGFLYQINESSTGMYSKLLSLDSTKIPATTTAVNAVNTTLGTINTNVTAVNTKLTADALVQTDILGNGLDILAETTKVLTELKQSRGKAKTLILESYRATPFLPTSPMNLGANLGMWNNYFNSESLFVAVEVLNGGKCIKLTGYGEHWMPESTFGDLIDHQIDKILDEDGLFTSCGAGCLKQFTSDSVISVPKLQTAGSGCFLPVFGAAPTRDTGKLDISSLVSADNFMGGASAAGVYLTVKRNETFAKSAEYLAVKAVANFIEVPVGEESQILAELQGLKTSVDADALVQVSTYTLIDTIDSNISFISSYTSNLEGILQSTVASSESLVEVSTKLDTLNTSAATDYTLQGQILDAALDYGTVVDVIRILLQEVIPATTPTQTSVSGSATSVTLVAANALRRSLTIFNNSNAHLFICASATATQATAICRIDPYGYYEMPTPRYLGVLSGIWDAAHGNASIYEGV